MTMVFLRIRFRIRLRSFVTFNISTVLSPYGKITKVSQQVNNLNHSCLSNAQYVFAVFFTSLSPTITIQQLSDIFWQFTRRYSRICSSIVPRNSPRNFVCIVPWLQLSLYMLHPRHATWSKSHVLRSHPSINNSTDILASNEKVKYRYLIPRKCQLF